MKVIEWRQLKISSTLDKEKEVVVTILQQILIGVEDIISSEQILKLQQI